MDRLLYRCARRLDTLVFAEASARIHPSFRGGANLPWLDFLGVKLSVAAQREPCRADFSGSSRVKVRVIRTNEELMIARAVVRTLNL